MSSVYVTPPNNVILKPGILVNKIPFIVDNYTFYEYSSNSSSFKSSTSITRLFTFFVIIYKTLFSLKEIALYHNHMSQYHTFHVMDTILLWFIADADEQDQEQCTIMCKVQTRSIRLQLLFTITGTIYYAFINYNLLNKLYENPLLKPEYYSINREKFKLPFIEKTIINDCTKYIGDFIIEMEKKFKIHYEGPNDKIWLTQFDKDLLEQYAYLIPNFSDAIHFKQLLYLFVHSSPFINYINSFEPVHCRQLKRYLYELLLWFRFLQICKFIIKKHPNKFSIKSFEPIEDQLKQKPSIDVNLNIKHVSKKNISKIIFLFNEAMDHYIYDTFSYNLIIITSVIKIAIKTNVEEKKN